MKDFAEAAEVIADALEASGSTSQKARTLEILVALADNDFKIVRDDGRPVTRSQVDD